MMMTLLLALMQAAPAAPAPDGPIASPLPGWMAGCWMAEGEGHRVEECWTVPRGQMMLASAHAFNGPRTLMFEHMRIVREDASLVYIAQPRGAPPTRFAMLGTAAPTPAGGVTFQNLANDYPQRISYRMVGTEMVAEIAMADGSRLQRWTFRRPR